MLPNIRGNELLIYTALGERFQQVIRRCSERANLIDLNGGQLVFNFVYPINNETAQVLVPKLNADNRAFIPDVYVFVRRHEKYNCYYGYMQMAIMAQDSKNIYTLFAGFLDQTGRFDAKAMANLFKLTEQAEASLDELSKEEP